MAKRSASAAWCSGHIQRWKADPNAFVRETMGVKPDPWQEKVLSLLGKEETRRLAMKAAKGPGKTGTLAWVILWFLTCHYQSKIGCTSITGDNIATNLWPEINKWLQRSEFLRATFTWTSTHVTRKGDESWFAVKRTWPKSGSEDQQKDALAGIHADDVMFVLDESGGIPQSVMITAEAILATRVSGHRAIVIQAGNPTHTTGPLHRACTVERHLWEVVEITGDPEDPNRSTRIDKQWAQEQIDTWGRDNPWVMVNVLGKFPPASINALLSAEDVNAAMNRTLDQSVYSWAQKRLGIDVARFGDDRTVIFPRQGLASFKPVVMRGAATTAIAARVAQAKAKWGSEMELIDDTGHWGHGVIDNLQAAQIHSVYPVVYHAPAIDSRYANRRAEMWITGCKAIREGGAALPNLPEMIGELTESTYLFVNGKFQLEPKDLLKKRIGRSPDLADAYMLTYAMPDMPSDVVALEVGAQTHRAEIDFDPFR